jgi:hypothetical protein
MNVTSIRQGPGSVVTLRGPHEGATAPERGPKQAATLTRVAWFDLNGDGNIDNRNPLEGGDGTMLVPAHTADVTSYPRAAARPRDAESALPPPPTSDLANGARTQRVIDAYQRYGDAPKAVSPDVRVA